MTYSDHLKTPLRLDLCSWKEVESYLTVCKAIILPIGSIEQHGPTGAIGTDAMTAQAVALEVSKRSKVLVAPVQHYGMAEHHLGFPGTMSIKPSTLLVLMHDLLCSLARHGFQRVFVINGHGGNIATLKAAFAESYKTILNSDEFQEKDFRCKLKNWFMVPEVFQKANELYGEMEGQHATPSEISLTLHLEPSLQDKQVPLQKPVPAGPIYSYKDFQKRYPDGRMGSDPYLAKSTHGKVFLEKAASNLSNDLLNFLKES